MPVIVILILILLVLISIIVFLSCAIAKIVKYADASLHNTDRYREYFNLLNQWMLLKQRNINISDSLMEKGYRSIAVYGMGAIGLRLCDELKNSSVHIERTIDCAANTIYHPLGVWKPDVGLLDIRVDAVILTVDAVDESTIRSYMNNKEIPVVRLSDIIYSI